MSKPRCRSCGASGHDVKSDDTTSKDGKAWVIHQCWMCGNQWVTAEHALLSPLLAIAASEEKYGQLLPEVLNQRTHKDTKEPAYEYALRVGMEIGNGKDES